ncbi:threonylcarbamoyl-AMP synthase [Candidatus Woesebacteria bacterium]|nr:threonylcarbamoyl-AMP synthase [Candidatus Woesebacteria bacterium]
MLVLSTQSCSTQEIITKTLEVLSNGGLVIYPTETTYGVGVDIENSEAVEKLFRYKGQRNQKPISVAVSSKEMATRYVSLNAEANRVYDTFLPGPVTVVSTGIKDLPDGVASTEGKVGIRIPNYELMLSLISQFGRGISATGANASNQKRPYTIQDVLDHTSKEQQSLIDLIIDAGTLPLNEPSTVIDTTLDDIVILRAGSTAFKKSETIVTTSPEETMEVFSQVAKRYRSYYGYTPVLFAFQGVMGAGKTHAIKGLAKGLGIDEMITSPTYTFAHEFSFINEGKTVQFAHIDAWRVQSFPELMAIGFEQYLQQNGVIALEWSERFYEELVKIQPLQLISVQIESTLNENERRITISSL